MSKKRNSEEIGFALRFPNAKLKRDIEKLAKEEKRSLNNFIITMLEKLTEKPSISGVVKKNDNL